MLFAMLLKLKGSSKQKFKKVQ